MTTLTENELTFLASQVDVQLAALQSDQTASSLLRAAEPDASSQLPVTPEQRILIEQATGEKFETFWGKFLRLVREDLCLPGGKLHEQWQKLRDLDSKTAVTQVHGILVGMGIGANSVAPVAVAVTVFLLTVVLNIGIKAICEGCEQQ